MLDECIDHGRKGNSFGQATVNLGGGRYTSLHRKIYADHAKVTLESLEGLDVRHRCDNARCINPAHLEIGTHAQNMQDMVDRGRQNSCTKEKHGRARLTGAQVKEARELYIPRDPDRGASALARRFNVSVAAMHAAITNKSWR